MKPARAGQRRALRRDSAINQRQIVLSASLVALAMAKQVRLFLSPAILEECAAVLKRPKFQLDLNTVDRFLRDLTRTATMVRPARRVSKSSHEPDN
jgi:predicted nucleic acid-binding protein